MAAISSQPTATIALFDKYEKLVRSIGPDVFVDYCRDFPFLAPSAKPVFGPHPTSRYEPLETTLGRKVVCATELFFLAENKKKIKSPEDIVKTCHINALYDALKKSPDFEVIRDHAGEDKKQCDWYVFQNEEWYKKISEDGETIHRMLFEKDALQNLEKQGYERIWSPEVGAIIIYFNSKGEAVHYGKVFALGPKSPIQGAAACPQGVIVESSFHCEFVARHPQASIPAMYGTHFAYMRKKK